ncbi:hypothetical protein EGW08_000841 [Elysia chlorotica]|uniref:Apple domain-containing protein n=1 Tax=Elysia chlorotica TaxID=188477 RepID=A0A3S1AGJ4_ELYCH|nr:hypothetical protein EGW08_000841 [Elysia chlorotica]
MFDLHLLNNSSCRPSKGHSLCQGLGYDGLAVLSSPEAYRLALELTAHVRISDKSRVAVGLFYHSTHKAILWADDTLPAHDTPWSNPPPTVSGYKPYGRMTGGGSFLMTTNTFQSHALCGRYDMKEAVGKTLVGKAPANQTSHLEQRETTSFMKCVVLCSTDGRCRAAEYNLSTSTCTVFDAGMFLGFSENPTTNTFTRDGF